jgi:peptide chain release factor 1
MLNDGLYLEMRELAQQELADLRQHRDELEGQIKLLLLPRDKNDDKNVVIEIRQGEGGDEAALFAADLYRMYQRYAEGRHWKSELISVSENGIGGFKEVVFEINGEAAYSRFKYEGGVHRVQRVPETEARGRIHTSTATVAVLPEIEPTEVGLRDEDYRVDVFRSQGHGGQGVNTTDSAVRIVYRGGTPEEIVVTCQDNRSQLKNKAQALMVLRARIYAREQARRQQELGETRLAQVGTGERAEKIRTDLRQHRTPESGRHCITPLAKQRLTRLDLSTLLPWEIAHRYFPFLPLIALLHAVDRALNEQDYQREA